MEKKPSEEAKEISPATSKMTLVKLVLLILLAFFVMKYGVPLMDQISEKSVAVLESKEVGEAASEKVEEANDNVLSEVDPKTKPQIEAVKSSVRITKGYQAWESGVRGQLENWIDEGSKYKLTSIAVNEAQGKMEIRYSTEDADGYVGRGKLMLSKDGFGERFSFAEGEKEFIVYPPE